jgi:uncharacterized protein YcaQ
VVAAIERMRLLQIDTIHVVARSPYLIPYSRLGNYPMVWLEDALAEGRLAECWAHEAWFVSAADIGWHRANMGSRAHHWAQPHAERSRREHASSMDVSERVLTRLNPSFNASAALISTQQARRWAIADSVWALGVAQSSRVADFIRLKPKVTDAELAALTATGELLPVLTQGWVTPGYVHRDYAELREKALRGCEKIP